MAIIEEGQTTGVTTDTSSDDKLVLPSGTTTAPSLTFDGDEDTGLSAAVADQVSIIAGGVEGVRVTESGSAITAVDVNGPTAITHTAPTLTITNTTASDSHLARDGLIAFKGTQSGGEVTTLASITAEHFNASDDQKGVLTIAVNDGNDNDAPTDYLKLSTNQAEFNVKLKSKVGSEAEPGYAFYNDPNTGMFGDESDALGLSTAGVARVNIDAAGATTITGPTSTVGIFATTGGGTVGTGGSSDATLEQSSASTFQTALHVGAAIKIVDSGDGEVFLRTVASITDANTLEMDEAAVVENGSAWYHDGGELFAVKTGDSKTLFGVNETGAIQAGSAAADSTVQNFAIGDSDALDTATSGTRNYFIGHASDNYKITTGSKVIGIGYAAGEDNSSGSDSIYVGAYAGQEVNNDGNVYIGSSTGRLASGGANVAVGHNSMQACTGSSSTAVGYQSLDAAGDADNCVAMGHTALGATTNNGNTGVGYRAGQSLTSGQDCTFLGADSGGTGITVDADNQTCIGSNSAAQGANTIMLGASTVTGLHCYDTSITSPSDSRIKENVEDSSLGLDFINALRPVKFQKKHPSQYPSEIREARWSDREEIQLDENGVEVAVTVPADTRSASWEPRTEHGLLAQEVKAAMDAHDGADWQGHAVLPSGMEALSYGNLIPVLVKALQELTARIATLEAGD